MSQTLDDLHLHYFNTLDTYQSLTHQLSAELAKGFISLAAANVGAPPPGGGRYGREQFEYRSEMKAKRGVRIIEAEGAEGSMRWEGVELQEEVQEEKEEEGGLRRRRVGPPKPEPETNPPPPESSPEPAAPPPHPSPLSMFHPLPPLLLRTAASSFTATLPLLPHLATTLHTLHLLSSQITLLKHKYVYKLLPEPPSFPLELSQLDRESGYIHLCTLEQAPGVVERFMGGCEEVWVLKVLVERLKGEVRWEDVEGEKFPHLYGELEEGAVEGVGKWGLGEVEWRDS
ncbi:hypothetical protein BDD12DRAFT_536102 [Trichophaea hybrida]|nr:hypothetical protein BDD12DRAFT_536102 [Trichophaea hybrida]